MLERAARRGRARRVTFHGRLDDAAVTELMESCSALCLPGVEDFGITPVEAHAAGKPVVAFGAGGALETVEEGFDGAFFHAPTTGGVPRRPRAPRAAADLARGDRTGCQRFSPARSARTASRDDSARAEQAPVAFRAP